MDFCASCSQLDISVSSFISHPGSVDNPRLDAPIYSLGTLEQINTRSHGCKLCRLLFAAFRGGPLRNITGSSDLRQIVVCGTWINALGRTTEQLLKSPALSILVWPESPRIPQTTYKIVVRAISRLFPNQPYFGQLSSGKSSLLDFKLINRWLHHCEQNHESCYGRNRNGCSVKPTENFLVIDVQDNCIVCAPDACRYIALSYVWGSTTQLTLTSDRLSQFSRKHSLRDVQLARTIYDATELVKKLGERYLWVDALCIVQDSETIRDQCIQDMDRIYAQSLLTVIAGTAKDSSSPLPGVTEKRVWREWISPISKNFALSAHFDFKDFLECSKYNQRAWTFQEYQLANRLLVFASNGQVYYSCKEAVYSEDVVLGKALESDAAMREGAELIKLRPNAQCVWNTYRRGVQTFTSRSMTHDRDILNAFKGILRMICPGQTLEGIPTSIFDLALLWQPNERLTRRAGFSSWSWAGWAGKVHWFNGGPNDDLREESDIQDTETWLKEKCWIIWYTSSETETNSTASATQSSTLLRGSSSSPAEYIKRFGSEPETCAPSQNLLSRSLVSLESPEICVRYLQFWTISAYFAIEPDTSAVLKFSSLEPENTGNGLRLFLLRDTNGQTCGWVLLDNGWVDRAIKEPILLQEFILLSEEQNHVGKELPYGLYTSNKKEQINKVEEYNAMMITWTGGLAERAGLGRINKGALCHTFRRELKWKEILLG